MQSAISRTLTASCVRNADRPMSREENDVPEMQIRLVHEMQTRLVGVWGLEMVIEGFQPHYDIEPWETSAQALQRHFPDCEIWIGNLRVNAPGNREWIA